jgi:hypothetical protein
MRLPPAWRAIFALRLRDPSGFVTVYRFDGSCTSEQFEFVGNAGDDSDIVAHVKVTSWHPYEVDALPDCLRAARDLCNVMSIAIGQFGTFELAGDEPSSRSKRRSVARSGRRCRCYRRRSFRGASSERGLRAQPHEVLLKRAKWRWHGRCSARPSSARANACV